MDSKEIFESQQKKKEKKRRREFCNDDGRMWDQTKVKIGVGALHNGVCLGNNHIPSYLSPLFFSFLFFFHFFLFLILFTLFLFFLPPVEVESFVG